jgi:hypothetical protein
MGDHPQWDYWRYEHIEDYGSFPIDHVKDLNVGDWRNKKYDLDTKIWCKAFFWNADEAAFISFNRDPAKLKNAEKFVSWDEEEDEEFKKHIGLKNQILALRNLIVDSQSKKILTDIFRPEMYIEWANHVGVSIPSKIPQELELAERQRNYQGRPPNIFERASGDRPTAEMLAVESDDLSDDSEARSSRRPTRSAAEGDFDDLSTTVSTGEHLEEESTELGTRRENSFCKIILVLWEMLEVDQRPYSLIELTDTISVALEAKEKKDRRFALRSPTLKSILKKARNLYKN